MKTTKIKIKNLFGISEGLLRNSTVSARGSE